MLKIKTERLIAVATGSLFATLACAASATEAELSAIDAQLEGQLDFRASLFEACFSEQTCTIGDLTITAERRDNKGEIIPALIYWDPIDGLGVMGGQQNDEIDVDEYLTIEFAKPTTIDGSWLSDLFIGEGARYQGLPYSSDDVEMADIALFDGDQAVERVRVSGVFELPDDPFNETVADIFSEDGDLLNRILIDEAKVSVFMPNEKGTEAVTLAVGNLDPEKVAVFTENSDVEIELAELVGNDRELKAFEVGSANANRLLELRAQLQQLEDLRARAEAQRLVGDVSNGELGWFPGAAVTTDRIVFSAGYQTSSDYSVAGLLLTGAGQ